MSGDSTQKVSLGCGTLILIALIVLIFSGGNNASEKRELVQLRDQVAALRNEVVGLRQQIERQEALLRDRLPPKGALGSGVEAR